MDEEQLQRVLAAIEAYKRLHGEACPVEVQRLLKEFAHLLGEKHNDGTAPI